MLMTADKEYHIHNDNLVEAWREALTLLEHIEQDARGQQIKIEVRTNGKDGWNISVETLIPV